MRFRILSSVLTLLLISLCLPPGVSAQSSQEKFETVVKENPASFIETPIAGMGLKVNENKECVLVDVYEGFAAAKAGLRRGDVLVTIDGRSFASQRDVVAYIFLSKRPGDTVQVTVRRGGEVVAKEMVVGKRPMLRDQYVLRSILLGEGKPAVRLAIVSGEITRVLPAKAGKTDLDKENIAQWKKAVESQIVAAAENGMMRTLGDNDNFSLIDRQAISHLQNEMRYQESGLVSADFRSKLGGALGATHILVLDMSRLPTHRPGTRFLDTTTRRLIEVESGKTLSSVLIKETVE
ncbi:MAG: PDZ domain-containing protein [Smithellaceae bacterium]|nr:PDZ domain-containing protein [Smithellaceae bacterium]